MEGLLCIAPHVTMIPISIYYTIKLYSYRKDIWMQKRSSSLTISFNIALILCMISNVFAVIATLYFNSSYRFFVFIISTSTMFNALYFLNVTNWMSWYKYYWIYYTLQVEWQNIINPTNNGNSNWFIKNNNHYGKLSFILKLFGIIHFIAALIFAISLYVTMVVIKSYNWRLTLSVVIVLVFIFLAFVIFYVIIRWKTPFFNDTMYVYWESKMYSKILLIGTIFYLLFSVIAAYITSKGEQFRKIASTITWIELFIIWFSLNYISTVIIPFKNKRLSTHRKIPGTASSHSLELTQSIDENELNKVLLQDKSINLFMKYLSREFSMEILLAYIEFNQFEQFIFNQVSDEYKINVKLVNFPSNIPLSKIIQENKQNTNEIANINDIKNIAHKLYTKYILVGAEFELNLSGLHRESIINKIGDLNTLLNDTCIDINEIFQIFEKCREEMICLLLSSLNRFKYDDLQQESSSSGKVSD
eukprot:336199_1